jgi:predicted phage terminase large subunit-like protein
MVFEPPRHGKSEMATIRYPVWRIEREPEMRVIIGSYGQELANTFNRKARRLAVERIELAEERKAASDWHTAAGGGMRAVGVGAGVTGHGAHLIVIDDPVKNREEASSEIRRETVWNWYNDDLYTRLEPGGAIVLIMTRWHEDDLAGRILASDRADDWTVLSLPALAEEDDPLGREPGQALCPERFDEEALERIRRGGLLSWYALYQQRPQPPEGGMFKLPWFTVSDALPHAHNFRDLVRYWDKAGTADAGAYTAGVLMGLRSNGDFWVLDVVRGQWSSGERERVILQTAHTDMQTYQLRNGPAVDIWVEQEPGSGGKESAEHTIRNLAGFRIHAERVTGDKVFRAEPYAAQAEAGNVKVAAGDWTVAYLNELASFPTGAYADQVDASSGAFNKLAERMARRVFSY